MAGMYSDYLERIYKHVMPLDNLALYERARVLDRRIEVATEVTVILSARVVLNACIGEISVREKRAPRHDREAPRNAASLQ